VKRRWTRRIGSAAVTVIALGAVVLTTIAVIGPQVNTAPSTPGASNPSQTLLGLPTGFWDGILGAIVGGLLTGVAGFLASWYVDRRQSRRDSLNRLADRDAAVKVVRYELGINAAKLEMYVAHNTFPGRLTDAAFQESQRLLTRELPETLSAGLVWAYEQMAVAQNNITSMIGMPAANRPQAVLDPISQAATELDATRAALTAFLEGAYDPNWLAQVAGIP
jgi:hypothetical protein